MSQKVQYKLVTLLTAVIIAFLAVAVFLQVSERHKRELYLANEKSSREGFFDKLVELKGTLLASFVSDYTYWDEFVEFLVTSDSTWGRQMIQSSLPTFHADVAWVHRLDGSLVYGTTSDGEGDPGEIPVPRGIFSGLFAKSPFCHFFAETPKGIMEIRGGTVHPSADKDRKTPPRGYFFVGRLWTEEYVEGLSRLVGGKVELRTPGFRQGAADGNLHPGGTLTFSRPLLSWDAKPVGELHVRYTVGFLEQMAQMSRLILVNLGFFAVAILSALSFYLVRWVSRPLRLISEALSAQDPRPIRPLLQDKTEFGHIARITDAFFAQKRKLEGEIAVRTAAEEALKDIRDQLEKRVKERTSELEETNRALQLEINERKHAEEALRKNERFLADVFDSIQDGISILTPDLDIVRVNPVVEKWFPQAVPLAGKKCFEVYFGRTQPCDPCPCDRTMKSGRAEYEVTEEKEWNNPSGRWLDIYSFPLIDALRGTPRGVIEYVRDATERKRLEQQVIQAQKMESLGLLAGGVAHDFGNILQGVLGYATMMKRKMQESDPFYRYVDTIEKGGLRAVALNQQLLMLARSGRAANAPKLQPVELNGLVLETIGLIRETFGVSIEVDTHLGEGLPDIMGDSSQIQQVLLNLCVNARDAMPMGGRLTILTRTEDVDELDFSALPPPAKGRYLHFAVTDTGEGMSPEIQRRIFDPFFTTKPKGKGTGLGLAVVYGVVKNHGGFIRISSMPGRGSTFSVFFPLDEGGERNMDGGRSTREELNVPGRSVL